MKARTLPQSARFHALCGEVAQQYPLIPYRRAFACEVWKRYFTSQYVRDARLSAFYEGWPDPFPVRPVPTSSLDSVQMSDLLECAAAWCANNGVELLK